MKRTYSRDQIKQALIKAGVKQGDTLFLHANLGFFGLLEGADSTTAYASCFFDCFKELIGPKGNICVPTFTYSFCKGEPFDKDSTASQMGIFSEYVRQYPQALRSEDANFSVAVIGNNSLDLTSNVPDHSFGVDSFWERFLLLDGKICNLNFDAGSTFIHYIEKKNNAPYRHDKPFSGQSFVNGQWQLKTFYHFVRDLNKPEWDTSMPKVDELLKNSGIISSIRLGRGAINLFSARDNLKVIEKAFKQNPYVITVSGVNDEN